MSQVVTQHVQRLKQATVNKQGRRDLAVWIEKNTKIANRPFSFKGHEYQHKILQDESTELVIRKSAQTGISEMSMRMALGLLMIMPGSFRIGYTMPTATQASAYSKMRLSPIITSSDALSAASGSGDLDSAEMKTFGMGKELHFKGAAVGNAAISTTLDMLFHDELSFSDPDVIGDYWSRVLHSSYKWRVSLSTPTWVGDAIDVAFTNSRQHWNMCKCDHCRHVFIPDFYLHVVVPGWDKPLDEITESNLHTVRYQETKILCPRCGKEPSLAPEHREWVCKNPTENHIAAGYQVQPFDAPTIVTPKDLIIASTKYATKTKFRQFSLGRPATDVDSGLVDEDLDRVGVVMAQSPFTTHVMGCDMGLYCHIAVGGVAGDSTLVVVHYERVALKDFRTRYAALAMEYRVVIKVVDIQPYTDIIMSMSQTDPNLFAARYVTRNGLEVYDVKDEAHDADSAIEGVHEVSVNRNGVFDKLMSLFRPEEGQAPGIVIRKCTDWELVKQHATAMKRMTAEQRNSEFSTQWVKPANGQDHYWHTLGYLWVAAQMRGIAVGHSLPMMGVTTFKVTPKKK